MPYEITWRFPTQDVAWDVSIEMVKICPSAVITDRKQVSKEVVHTTNPARRRVVRQKWVDGEREVIARYMESTPSEFLEALDAISEEIHSIPNPYRRVRRSHDSIEAEWDRQKKKRGVK